MDEKAIAFRQDHPILDFFLLSNFFEETSSSKEGASCINWKKVAKVVANIVANLFLVLIPAFIAHIAYFIYCRCYNREVVFKNSDESHPPQPPEGTGEPRAPVPKEESSDKVESTSNQKDTSPLPQSHEEIVSFLCEKMKSLQAENVLLQVKCFLKKLLPSNVKSFCYNNNTGEFFIEFTDASKRELSVVLLKDKCNNIKFSIKLQDLLITNKQKNTSFADVKIQILIPKVLKGKHNKETEAINSKSPSKKLVVKPKEYEILSFFKDFSFEILKLEGLGTTDFSAILKGIYFQNNGDFSISFSDFECSLGFRVKYLIPYSIKEQIKILKEGKPLFSGDEDFSLNLKDLTDQNEFKQFSWEKGFSCEFSLSNKLKLPKLVNSLISFMCRKKKNSSGNLRN